MNRMTFACLASLAVFAEGLVALAEDQNVESS